jgi:hypothetical protein
VLPCTAVFSLEVERGHKIAKVTAKNPGDPMAKIRLLDALDVLEGGVGDINCVCLDEVEEALLVFMTPLLCSWLGWH